MSLLEMSSGETASICFGKGFVLSRCLVDVLVSQFRALQLFSHSKHEMDYKGYFITGIS